MADSTEKSKPHQVLRLKIEGRYYNGLVVSMTEETMMVATTIREKPELELNTVVQGEMPKPDGLYHFATRIRGMQMAPVLVLMLDMPKALRKVQRRREPRYPVTLEAHLIYISSDLTINTGVRVTNLSFGGAEVIAPTAAPVGYHCIVLLNLGEEYQLSTICTVIHSEGLGEEFRLGLSFVEMSREDQDVLHDIILRLEAESG
jgi:c-di-GMP-binding flagellar brake protein YcgR